MCLFVLLFPGGLLLCNHFNFIFPKHHWQLDQPNYICQEACWHCSPFSWLFLSWFSFPTLSWLQAWLHPLSHHNYFYPCYRGKSQYLHRKYQKWMYSNSLCPLEAKPIKNCSSHQLQSVVLLWSPLCLHLTATATSSSTATWKDHFHLIILSLHFNTHTVCHSYLLH